MLRFAQSPTADMHLGNLRIAVFNFILSKQRDEELLIRIDDTDKEKNIESKDKQILELLNLFGIEYSRVILQSENIKYHTQLAMKLLLDKKAFNCFCSDEALESDRIKAKKEGKPYSYSGFCEGISDETKFNCNAPFVVRLKKPEQNIKFHDLLKGDFNFEPFDVDSNVILAQDKSPVYDFACALDDMLYDISLVIRSEKYISNTPKQMHMRKSLSYDKQIEYAHFTDILNINDKEDIPSVKSLIDEGYLPAAIVNYLLLLDYDTPKEIFTLEEAIGWFDINKVFKSPKKFDINKLREINKEYLKNIDSLRLSKLLGYADEDIGTLGKIYLENLCTIKEIKEKVDKIFAPKDRCEGFDTEYKNLKSVLKDMPFIKSFDEFKSEAMKKSGLNGDGFFIPLSYALTGEKTGENLSEIYPCIKNYLGEII